jgi:hypothetical protein
MGWDDDEDEDEDGMGWDGMGWDGVGWDGVGWDGMGWDGMGWDGMGWDGVPTSHGISPLSASAAHRTTIEESSRDANVGKLRPTASGSRAARAGTVRLTRYILNATPAQHEKYPFEVTLKGSMKVRTPAPAAHHSSRKSARSVCSDGPPEMGRDSASGCLSASSRNAAQTKSEVMPTARE